MTATTRLGFSMARDGALPFSKFFYKVNPNTQSPDRLTFLIVILGCLINILVVINIEWFWCMIDLAVVGF